MINFNYDCIYFIFIVCFLLFLGELKLGCVRKLRESREISFFLIGIKLNDSQRKPEISEPTPLTLNSFQFFYTHICFISLFLLFHFHLINIKMCNCCCNNICINFFFLQCPSSKNKWTHNGNAFRCNWPIAKWNTRFIARFTPITTSDKCQAGTRRSSCRSEVSTKPKGKWIFYISYILIN